MNLKYWIKKNIGIALFCPLVLFSAPAYAAAAAGTEISWFFLLIGLTGGLSFFLYGMEKMSTGMKRSTGNKMRSILAALTGNRVIGMIAGAFVTCVIQSSSATTVMLVSFVQAGLMSFVNSLGVILGADIGTTITAQLIAFKLTDYALLMIAVGFRHAAGIQKRKYEKHRQCHPWIRHSVFRDETDERRHETAQDLSGLYPNA